MAVIHSLLPPAVTVCRLYLSVHNVRAVIDVLFHFCCGTTTRVGSIDLIEGRNRYLPATARVIPMLLHGHSIKSLFHT